MAITDQHRQELLNRLDLIENGPSLEDLLASNQVVKKPGGYLLLTAEAREALKHRFKSMGQDRETGRLLVTLYPLRKSTAATLRKILGLEPKTSD